MKTRKRIPRLIRNIFILLLFLVCAWLDSGLEPLDRLERLRENYMLEEPASIGQGLAGEQLYRLDDEILLFGDIGGSTIVLDQDRSVSRSYARDLQFFQAQEDITLIPSAAYGGPHFQRESIAFYALAEVPGAAYAEGELRIYDKLGKDTGSSKTSIIPWDETYSLHADVTGALTCFTLSAKYDSGDDNDRFFYEQTYLGQLSDTAEGIQSLIASYTVTLRYYAADGTLLAEFDKALAEYDSEYFKNGFTIGALTH